MNDMFNEGSVCHRCWNEKGDKAECVDLCPRLHAYQRNQPWYHIPPYRVTQVLDHLQNNIFHAPIKRDESPLTPFGIRLKIEAGECFLCESKGNRRGLCEKCYDRWRKGYLFHPVEGLWKPNRKTRPKKIVAKKTRNHGISDEALRNVEPSLDAAVKRIEGQQKESRIITIDLCKYDKLYNKIMQESERDYVPISHTIINLLSIGMQVVERDAS